jgi:tight adherence protein B
MIDEIRVLTNSAGRSIPQALFEVGLRGPEPLRPAFEAAHREWILSTNFERTTTLLKSLLADTTADAACETLLVAHEVGGSDLDRRLAELAEDRRQEYLGRMDARSKQSGVRFARNFVLLVPLGMAGAGLTLGDGRAAYQKPFGQILVAFGLGLVGICWMWSARMLRLPETGRVFDR